MFTAAFQGPKVKIKYQHNQILSEKLHINTAERDLAGGTDEQVNQAKSSLNLTPALTCNWCLVACAYKKRQRENE